VILLIAVVDLGEGPGGPRPLIFWAKKEEITGGRKASRVSKTNLLPP